MTTFTGILGANQSQGSVLMLGVTGQNVVSVAGTAHFTFAGAGTLSVSPSTGAAHFTFQGLGFIQAVGPHTVPTGPYQPVKSYQPFTYILTDLRSGAIKGELPFAGVSFGKTLNGVGQFQGFVDLQDLNFDLVDPLDLTTPCSTGLFVDYNGSIVWGGLILPRARTFQSQSRKMTVTASDLWGYFSQRVQATDYSAPPSSGITGPPGSPNYPMSIWDASATDPESIYDPLLIAWQIIADALAVQGYYGNILGGLGLAGNSFTSAGQYFASGSGTPVTNYINMTYPYASMQLVGTVVQQLSQLGYTVGFDVGVDAAYSAGSLSVPVATVNLSYPRRGRPSMQNNLYIDLSTAFQYSFPEDGTQAANVVYEIGNAGAITVSENVYPIEDGYPIFEVVKSRSQITSANALNILGGIGYSDLALLSYPAVVPQFTIDLFNTSLPLGSFIEGDDILVSIPATDGVGNIWDPGFPQGLYQSWRITQWQATVSDSGTSTLQITLNQPPQTQATQPPLSSTPG